MTKLDGTARGGALMRLQLKQVLAHEGDGAFRHFITLASGQHIGQRRFASAVRPHDRVDFPRVQRQVQALQDRLAVNLGVKRSEEHTSELQSLMRISYAVFCLKKKTK